MALGENIKKYREAANLSQSQLATLLSKDSASTISMWEKGLRKPSVDSLIVMSEIFNCTIDELFYSEK